MRRARCAMVQRKHQLRARRRETETETGRERERVKFKIIAFYNIVSFNFHHAADCEECMLQKGQPIPAPSSSSSSDERTEDKFINSNSVSIKCTQHNGSRPIFWPAWPAYENRCVIRMRLWVCVSCVMWTERTMVTRFSFRASSTISIHRIPIPNIKLYYGLIQCPGCVPATHYKSNPCIAQKQRQNETVERQWTNK